MGMCEGRGDAWHSWCHKSSEGGRVGMAPDGGAGGGRRESRRDKESHISNHETRELRIKSPLLNFPHTSELDDVKADSRCYVRRSTSYESRITFLRLLFRKEIDRF